MSAITGAKDFLLANVAHVLGGQLFQYIVVADAFLVLSGAVLAAYGVDAREAFRLFCEDRIGNISPAYLRPGFAFGGSCLPKDMRSLLALADQKNVATPFLSQVMPSNATIIDRVFDLVSQHPRGQTALFGLAFKPGTDDMRESPFVTLAERMLGKGWPLRIYDRYMQTARLVGSNRAIIEKEIPHLDRLMVGSIEDAIEGVSLVIVGHLGANDRDTLLACLKDQSVLDLVGIPALQNHQGIKYQGLCW